MVMFFRESERFIVFRVHVHSVFEQSLTICVLPVSAAPRSVTSDKKCISTPASSINSTT